MSKKRADLVWRDGDVYYKYAFIAQSSDGSFYCNLTPENKSLQIHYHSTGIFQLKNGSRIVRSSRHKRGSISKLNGIEPIATIPVSNFKKELYKTCELDKLKSYVILNDKISEPVTNLFLLKPDMESQLKNIMYYADLLNRIHNLKIFDDFDPWVGCLISGLEFNKMVPGAQGTG